MADMYSKIEQLCKENNTNITAMCRLLDISRSTLSELKAGRTKRCLPNTQQKLPLIFTYGADSYLLWKIAAKKRSGRISSRAVI